MKKSAVFTAAIALSIAIATTIGWSEQGSQTGPLLSQAYPTVLANGNFGKIVSGDFTGDLKLDAVVMDGQQPKLLVTPEVHTTSVKVGGPANDFAVLSLPGVTPVKDYLLTVSSAGLQRYERDSVARTWTTVPIDLTQTWAGARLVAVGALDAVDPPDIVGVAANGHDVLILYGQTNGQYVPGNPSFFSAIGSNIYALFTLNWRDAGDTLHTDEIALFSSYGVEVYEPNGTLLTSLPWTSPLLGTVIRDKGTSLQRLAMVSPVNGNDMLYVYGSVKSEGPYTMGPACTVSMASGDPDKDGDSDLFLGVNSEAKFWKLTNSSPDAVTFHTLAVKYSFGPTTRDPSVNHAGLAVADFNGDGYLDVVAPVPGDTHPPLPTRGMLAFVQTEQPTSNPFRTSIAATFVYHTDSHLQIPLADPTNKLTIPQGAPPATVKFSVMIWHTPNLTARTDSNFYKAFLLPLPAVSGGTIDCPVDLPDTYVMANDPDIWSLVIRQVVVTNEDPGTILAIGPAYIGLIAGGTTWPILRDTADTIFYTPARPGPIGTPDGGIASGPAVPSPDDDTEPRDRDPVR